MVCSSKIINFLGSIPVLFSVIKKKCLAVLDLRCCMGFSIVVVSEGYSPIAVRVLFLILKIQFPALPNLY